MLINSNVLSDRRCWMVEKHDLKRAEAEVEVGSAAALPANHLSGTRLAANVHRSVIAFAIRLWNLFGFFFFFFSGSHLVISGIHAELFWWPSTTDSFSSQKCVASLSAAMQRRCGGEQRGREGGVDEEGPRMLSEGVAPKEGR